MLAASAKMYVTNLLTNIRFHFFQYVERTVSELLKLQVTRVYGLHAFKSLPSAQRKEWTRNIRRAVDDVLFHRRDDAMKSDGWVRRWVERNRSRFVPALPGKVKTMDVDLTNTKRPYEYLPYMVKMNRCLEALNVKMMSPLPMSTSFIPSFYRIDTGCLQHLLMDKKRIEYFKKWHLRHYHRPLFLTSKAALAASTSKLLGVEKATVDEEASFKDAQWRLVGKWQRKDLRTLMPATPRALHRGTGIEEPLQEWTFGHSISTNGYSVYLSVTDGDRGRKGFKPRAEGTLRGGKRVQEFPELTRATAKEFTYLLDESSYTLLGGDPGKVNHLCLVDGLKKEPGNSHAMRYTGAQRRHESGELLQKMARERLKRQVRLKGVGFITRSGHYMSSPTVTEVETQYLRGASSRSCVIEVFAKYVRRRMTVEQPMEAFYRHARWRSERMSAKMKRRRSEQAFVQRIKEKFGIEGRQLAILYGNWGRRPNLKNQAPSPGVGLRRLIHRYITTITVAEWYTSSRCANCFGDVVEACRSRGLRKCQTAVVDCPTQYWDRDVMGALNIRHAGMHLLTHGVEHPHFRSDS